MTFNYLIAFACSLSALAFSRCAPFDTWLIADAEHGQRNTLSKHETDSGEWDIVNSN